MVNAQFYRNINSDLPLRITPGPFEVSPTVLEAASRCYAGHRSTVFKTLIAETRSMLLDAFEMQHKERYAAVILTGTGTAAMESMVAATVPTSRPLVIVNGRFGQRLADMALLYNSKTKVLDFGIGNNVHLAIVREQLEKKETDQILFCVQDTREGIRNPFKELCALARENDHMICVDAISANIAEEIYAEENDIDFFTASSGKAIRGLPGLGIVCGKKALFESLDSGVSKTYYLNLKEHYEVQEKKSEPRFAPATALYYALHQALIELLEEGVVSRRETILKRTAMVREAIHTANLEFLRPAEDMPNSVTSILLPKGVSFESFTQLYQEKGFLVYSGSSVIKDCVQIGTAGYLTDELLKEALDTMQQIIAT